MREQDRWNRWRKRDVFSDLGAGWVIDCPLLCHHLSRGRDAGELVLSGFQRSGAGRLVCPRQEGRHPRSRPSGRHAGPHSRRAVVKSGVSRVILFVIFILILISVAPFRPEPGGRSCFGVGRRGPRIFHHGTTMNLRPAAAGNRRRDLLRSRPAIVSSAGKPRRPRLTSRHQSHVASR